MINKSISNSVGLVKDVGYGTAGVSDPMPSKNASIMGNKYTKSDRCGYGVNGVDAGSSGKGPKRSSGRAAGAAR